MAAFTEFDLKLLASGASSAVVGMTAGPERIVCPVGDAQPGSSYRIASLTKALTAAATVRAAERAGVPLNIPVRTVLPELARDWAADPTITIAHALSQTSGLRSSVTGEEIAALGDDDDACFQAARLVVRAGSARRPGERWEYYNGNYFLAGAVLAALNRTSYERAVFDLVLEPWGLTSTSFEPPPDLVAGVENGTTIADSGYPRGRRPSGGLCSNVADLLTFAGGLLGDSNLLGQVSVARTGTKDPMRYGLGWAVGPSGQLFLNGRLPGYRAAMLLVPGHEVSAVVLAADTDALPAAAAVLSNLQLTLTGDDLTGQIDSFAA